MEPIGERLKKIRLEKGLTLDDVHRKTKIHLNVLKAIEEGSLVNFSPVYIKGFLKIYCKFLGLEYSDSLFDQKQAQPAVRPAQEKKKVSLPAVNLPPIWKTVFSFIRPRIRTIALVAVVFLLTLVLFNLGKFISAKSRQVRQKIAANRKIIPLPEKQEKKGITTKPRKIAEPQKPAAVQKPAAQVVLPKPQPPQKVEEPAAFSGIRLGIRAKEDCWLQVKTDGKTVFQNVLKKGRFENWQANDKIELSLGNAGVAELEVNGKFISSLGRRGQAVKNILITKEGLTTSR